MIERKGWGPAQEPWIVDVRVHVTYTQRPGEIEGATRLASVPSLDPRVFFVICTAHAQVRSHVSFTCTCTYILAYILVHACVD